MASPPKTPLRIGEVLEGARARRGLDIETVAERTKIRAKYLRALETEDWDVLPSTAYAKGFLRTYARLLGLDADALVDEYRRRVERGLEPEHLLPFAEPVLEARRRVGGLEEPPSRWRGPVLAGLAVAALAIVLVLVIAGGLGRESIHHRHRHGGAHGRSHGEHLPAGAPSGPLTLRLRALDGVQLCLVSSGRPVIDAQVLAPGSKAGPFDGRRFRLDLDSVGGGAVRLHLDGHSRKIHSRRPASYAITAGGVSRTSYGGPRCP
jgi:cytoskeleton protein RodZ